MSQWVLQRLMIIGAFALLAGGCSNNQPEARVNILRSRPVSVVEKMALASQKLGRPLVGVVRAETKSTGDKESLVRRCVLVFRAGKESPWITGKPGFDVYGLPPAQTNESPQELKAIVDRIVADRYNFEYRMGSSLTDNPDLLRREGGDRIRYWVRSGLFITAKTGFSDLVLNDARQLITVSFGSYYREAFVPGSGKETVERECLLEQPLTF